MTLSVIIPVFNTELSVLKKCVDSICKIRKYDYEIIIVDDGSVEKKSLSYKNEYKNNKKIKYYKKENGGVSSARNYGLDKATGDYIMFVDSDDILISENIDFSLLNQEYDIVVYNLSLIKNNNFYESKEISRDESGEIGYIEVIKDFVENDKFYSPVAKFISRQFLMKNHLEFNIEMINGEDAIFNLNMLLCKPKIYYNDNSIYGYYYDISNYDNRVKKYFDNILSDYLYKYNKKNEVIKNYLKNDTLIKKNQNDAIEQIFKISMICVNLKLNRKKEMSTYAKKFNIDYNNLSFKNKMKYMDIINEKWLYVHIISKIRKFYILIKWKS